MGWDPGQWGGTRATETRYKGPVGPRNNCYIKPDKGIHVYLCVYEYIYIYILLFFCGSKQYNDHYSKPTIGIYMYLCVHANAYIYIYHMYIYIYGRVYFVV